MTRGPFLESPLGGARDLLRLARRTSDVRTVAPWQTLRGLGRSHLRDPRLRMFLDRYATYTGSDPRRAPAALSVVPYVEQTFGAWYVRRRTAPTRRGRARAGGAARCPAAHRRRRRVGRGRGRPGSRRGARRRRADRRPTSWSPNADATHLYDDLLPRSVAGRARRRLHRATPVAVRLRAAARAARPHTRARAPHRAVPGRQLRRRVRRGLRPATRSRSTTRRSTSALPTTRRCDRTTTPRRGSCWSTRLVTAPAPARSTGTHPGSRSTYADRVLDVLARRGLDVRDRVLWREVRTPADLERRTRSPGGAIYGTSSNGARAAFLRPANASPVPGLFLVGGSSHPGGGLPLVGLSAAIVAGWSARPERAQPSRRRTTSRELAEADDAESHPGPRRRASATGCRAARRGQERRGDDHPGRPLPDGDHADLGHAGGGGPGPQVLLQQHQRAAERRRPAAARRRRAAPRGRAGRPPGRRPSRAPGRAAVARPVSTATAPSTLSSSAGQHDHGRREQQPPAAGQRREPSRRR